MKPIASTLSLVVVALAIANGMIGCRAPRETAGAVTSEGRGPRPSNTMTARVGYFPNVTHAQAVLGFSTARGDFVAALDGLANVEPKTFNAGPTAMEALHAGALDLCFVGPTPAINSFARGGDVTIIANVANGGTVLVARQGSGIAGVADLDGKSIAIPQIGNTQDAILRHLLAEAGIALSDTGGRTRVLPVENPDVLSLFARGELDAACVPEPWGARLEADAGAQVVLDPRAIWRDGDYPVTVLVGRNAFLGEHADVARRLVAKLTEITDELSADPDQYLGALNAELKTLTGKELKPEVLTSALGRIEFTTTVNPESLAAMAEVMRENRFGIASALRMPMTKIFGMSAAGFNAGDDDLENYNAMITSQVREPAKPIVRKVLRLLQLAVFGKVYDISFKFKPLRIIGAVEEETIKSSKQARYVALYSAQLLDAKEIGELLHKDNLVSIQTKAQQGLLPPHVTAPSTGQMFGDAPEPQSEAERIEAQPPQAAPEEVAQEAI